MSKEYAKDDDFSETKIAHLFIGPWLFQFYYLVINWVFQVKFKFIFNKLNGLKGKSLFINKLKCKRYQWEKNNGEQKTLELWTEVNIAEEIWKKKIVNIFILVFFKRKIMKMTICKKGMKNHSKRGQTFLRF